MPLQQARLNSTRESRCRQLQQLQQLQQQSSMVQDHLRAGKNKPLDLPTNYMEHASIYTQKHPEKRRKMYSWKKSFSIPGLCMCPVPGIASAGGVAANQRHCGAGNCDCGRHQAVLEAGAEWLEVVPSCWHCFPIASTDGGFHCQSLWHLINYTNIYKHVITNIFANWIHCALNKS